MLWHLHIRTYHNQPPHQLSHHFPFSNIFPRKENHLDIGVELGFLVHKMWRQLSYFYNLLNIDINYISFLRIEHSIWTNAVVRSIITFIFIIYLCTMWSRNKRAIKYLLRLPIFITALLISKWMITCIKDYDIFGNFCKNVRTSN